MRWCRTGQGRCLLSAVVFAGLASVIGCATAHHSPPPSAEASEPADRVGIDDTFDVRVYGESELSGTVDYPLAGRITVVGLRTGEIQQLIVARLKDRYLKDPQVVVTIKDRNSQKISVLGQVAKPGQVAYYPNMTIVDAIANAGGFTGIAAKNSVNLRREVHGILRGE